jgi:hypothetical protein
MSKDNTKVPSNINLNDSLLLNTSEELAQLASSLQVNTEEPEEMMTLSSTAGMSSLSKRNLSEVIADALKIVEGDLDLDFGFGSYSRPSPKRTKHQPSVSRDVPPQ